MKHPVVNLVVGEVFAVEYQLEGYEPGEIAHVENVMATEYRDRTHRRRSTITTSEVQEDEREASSENDLQTTDRSSLETEVSKVLKESEDLKLATSFSAGTQMVSFSASFDYGLSTSSEQVAKQASKDFSEIVSKAVDKVRERTYSKRERTTVEELEITNVHRFDNTQQDNAPAPTNKIGVYQWLDKRVQVRTRFVGRRSVLTTMVPEPGRFLRESAAQPASQSLSQAPVPFDHSPSEIDFDNYMVLALEYGADVEPPPSPHEQAATIIKVDPGTEGSKMRVESALINAPEGYRLHSVYVGINWPEILNRLEPSGADMDPENNMLKTDQGAGCLVQIAQESRYYYIKGGTERMRTVTGSGNLSGEGPYVPYVILNPTSTMRLGDVPVTVSSNATHPFAVTVKALFWVTEELIDAWRVETHKTIYQAYLRRREAWEEMQNLAPPSEVRYTSRAESLRQRERDEMRRHLLWNLTLSVGFPDDDNIHTTPAGVPATTIAALMDEGPKIAFLEGAIDWSLMAWELYPYFWADQSQWHEMLRTESMEQQHDAFLRAGYSRVSVPLKPGYEEAMASYLATGVVPEVGAELVSQEGLALLQGLAEDTPEEYVSETVEYLPTSLVMLRVNDGLPIDFPGGSSES